MVSKIKVIEIVEFFFLIIKTSNAEDGSQLLCIVNMTNRSQELFIMSRNPGGGLLPYKGLMGTCGQPGYVFRDFCLNQGIDFINFFLKLHCLQGQGMRAGQEGRAALPHPRIYRVPPPPPGEKYSCWSKFLQRKLK